MTLSRAVFDGDVLVYKAGFSVEHKYYSISTPGVDYQFSRLREAEKKIGELEEIGNSAIVESIKDVGTLKQAELNMISLIRKSIKDLGVRDYTIYLSPEDVTKGIRYQSAKTLVYKGNRKGEKPIHYKSLRAFAIRELSSVVAPDDLEADDMLGMSSRSSIICSIDKDLMMVPGTHYNLNTGLITQAKNPGVLNLITNTGGKKVLKGTGFKWFCAQMILGDAIDNIQGVRGVGVVGTYKLLNPFNKPQDMWDSVVKLYKEKGLDEDRIMENKMLLWINQPQTFEEILGDSNDGYI